MSTVTISVTSLDEIKQRARGASRGESQGEFITFPSVAVFTSVMTGKRWEIIEAMTGRGPMSVRNVARSVSRDVKAVPGDVQALLQSGTLDKTEEGQIVFPHDAVNVAFTIGKKRGFVPPLPTADVSKVRMGGHAPTLPLPDASKVRMPEIACECDGLVARRSRGWRRKGGPDGLNRKRASFSSSFRLVPCVLDPDRFP